MRAEQQVRQVLGTRADEAGHPEDLPGADLKRQVLQPPVGQVLDRDVLARPGSRRVFRARGPGGGQRHLDGTRFVRGGAPALPRRRADDEVDQRLFLDLARGHLGDDPPVPEHDDAVGDGADRDQVV